MVLPTTSVKKGREAGTGYNVTNYDSDERKGAGTGYGVMNYGGTDRKRSGD